jgi:coenzyme F420 hydrogenase subunit beta
MSPEGYLRPEQRGELSQAEDRLVAEICPGIRLLQDSAAGIDDPIWGPLVAVRTGNATNASLRQRASSGGVLSALLAYLLETGAVDYVVNTAAAQASPIENMIAESTGLDDIFRTAGSRYSPSAPLAELNRQLERSGRFALVGKPCDVAAVRALARHDPRVQKKIPIILSFFCAGVPSIHGAREILAKLGVREQDVSSFRFRGDGWPGFATARLRDGREARMSYAESWGGILSKHAQFRCKICPDGTGGFADVACGDAWYTNDKGYPLFEEAEGRSLIVSRTQIGEELVRRAIEAGYIVAQSLDPAEIVKMQPAQARRKQMVLSRLAAMALFAPVVPRFAGLQLWNAARTAPLWQNLKSFLGMAWRLLRGRSKALRRAQNVGTQRSIPNNS